MKLGILHTAADCRRYLSSELLSSAGGTTTVDEDAAEDAHIEMREVANFLGLNSHEKDLVALELETLKVSLDFANNCEGDEMVLIQAIF